MVEIKDYLFSDLWRIYEDQESQQEGIGREQHEQREREMLENQYEEAALGEPKTLVQRSITQQQPI